MKTRPFGKIASLAAVLAGLYAGQAAVADDVEVLFKGVYTSYAAVIQPADGGAASAVPADNPFLVAVVVWKDGTLAVGVKGDDGEPKVELHSLADKIECGDNTVLAFVNQTGSSYAFLDRYGDFSQILAIPDKGLVLLPLDQGDTRAARAAEMKGGATPKMRLSNIREILQWLSARASGVAASEARADIADEKAKAFLDAASANASGNASTGKRLFGGVYTQWGALMQQPRNPLDGGVNFMPSSPIRLDEFAVFENGAVNKESSGATEVFSLVRTSTAGGKTIRVYANESGAVHLAVSSSGDIIYFAHVPDWLYMVLFYDKGDTRNSRAAQLSRNGRSFPGCSFPGWESVMKWCYAQPVRVVNPPPGGGGGGGGGGGLGLCPNCRGRGTVMKPANPGGTHGPWFCPDCGGSSYNYHYHTRCHQCGGTGRIRM